MGAGGSRVVAGGALLPLLLLLLLLAGLAAPDWTDCPKACRCKWTNGKKTALCPNADLTSVPAALNPDMQVLDLTGNKIPNLPPAAFSSVGLLNLQRIFLKGAGLREVHRDAFRDLRILIEVDLSDNDITVLHQDTFAGTERLRVVCLSNNPLSELRSYQFPPLLHLRTLDFSHCHLEHIDEEALTHLAALESVNLKGNRLSHLSERVFAPLTKMKTLALDGNPWSCDCRLRSFRQWLLASKLYSMALACEEPSSLAGRPWEDVAPADFACAATVELHDRTIQQEAGGNVTFHCRASGDPEPEVTWYFNGRPVGANGTQAFGTETVYAIDQEDGQGLLEKWSNISVYNVSDSEAGEYGCQARNLRGKALARATLTLPVVVTATTLSKAESWLLWAGLATGGVSAVVALLVTIVCSCCFCGARRGRKRHRRKCNLKGSVSFTDQEKKLLDLSITTTATERHSQGAPSSIGSREMLGSSPDLELRPLPLPDPPLHITIESHSENMAVFPPPPEFSSSVLPTSAFGNIFISVSVSQEPGHPGSHPGGMMSAVPAALSDIKRFPDLLEFPHRAVLPAGMGPGLPTGIVKSVSVATGPDQPYVPMSLSTPSLAFATLPRRHLRAKETDVSVGGRAVPHYDNMGPRVTANGSSTLSLPDEDQLEATVCSRANSRVGSQDLPPPPPPPHCTSMSEYVAL